MYPDGKLYLEREDEGMTCALLWKWKGGNIALVKDEDIFNYFQVLDLPMPRWKPGAKVRIGPHRIRVLRWQPWKFATWVVRDDWRAPLWLFWDKAERSFKVIQVTIIRILCIWHLATHTEGAMYHWGEVHLIQRISRLLDTLKRRRDARLAGGTRTVR